jgi:hypothetical protein
MCRGGAVTLICCVVIATAAVAWAGTGIAATSHDCGNPPNWSGKLVAIGVGCDKARAVFRGIHCTDSSCEEIHSGAWECNRRTISRYKGRGNCHLGAKRMRWVVYE